MAAAEPGAEDGKAAAASQPSRWTLSKPRGKGNGGNAFTGAFRRKNGTSEKNRASGGSGSTSNPQEMGKGDSTSARRTIFFNLPLPEHAKDSDGQPLAHYERNKIRTARYTALSFVPKNLWYQFHNIANVYFLFLIILGVWP